MAIKSMVDFVSQIATFSYYVQNVLITTYTLTPSTSNLLLSEIAKDCTLSLSEQIKDVAALNAWILLVNNTFTLVSSPPKMMQDQYIVKPQTLDGNFSVSNYGYSYSYNYANGTFTRSARKATNFTWGEMATFTQFLNNLMARI